MKNNLTPEEINHFKAKLSEQKDTLEKNLAEVGHKNSSHPDDWEAVSTDLDESIKADKNEVADKIEEYEGNAALVKQFEIELIEVKEALDRIENATYGICVVGGEAIEKEKLEASPSTVTCIEHVNEKI